MKRSKSAGFYTAIYFTLHFLFLILLGNITALAPDENMYLDISKNVYSEKFNSIVVMGWSVTSQPFLFLIYLPAKILTNVGISPLFSLRLYVVFIGTYIFWKLTKELENQNNSKRNYFGLLAMVSLLPSFFIWSSLGLREVFIYLSLFLISFYLYQYLKVNSLRNLIGMIFGLTLMYLTKSYVYYIVFLSIIIVILFNSRSLNLKLRKVIVLATLVPLLVLPFHTYSTLNIGFSFISAKLTPTPTNLPNPEHYKGWFRFYCNHCKCG